MNAQTVVRKVETQFSCQFGLNAMALTQDECHHLGICPSWLEDGKVTKEVFFQLEVTGHKHTPSSRFPMVRQQRDHSKGYVPVRPPKPTGHLYKRYDVMLEKQISFRSFDLETDLAIFTTWMNDPRVAEFWEQAWSEEKLREFVASRLSDTFTLPLIGEFNGQPFGYFEVYWANEDRLAPYYECHEFDRGIHLLVGEQRFRGKSHFNSWIRALCHYIYLDDVRTQRIVMEPRFDNLKLFKRLNHTSFEKCFEFNFPHKRSALMMMSRDRFFLEAW